MSTEIIEMKLAGIADMLRQPITKQARRERIATAAMQGLLASGEEGVSYLASASVALADALIKELDK